MRATIHYILAAVLLIIYGGQVCPFIESLSLLTLSGTIAAWFCIFFIVRLILDRKIIDMAPPLSQASHQFILEMAIFCGAGLALTFFNMAAFNFPFDSGLKLFVGCLTLGFFTAADLSLARDYQVARELTDIAAVCVLPHRFFSLTRKLTAVAIVLAAVISVVLTLVILHDLSWIIRLPDNADLTSASKGIILEFAFVLLVLLSLTYNLIISYTRNMKLYFDRQTSVLEEVAGGKMDGHVPVTTSDEFGVIARYTNQMIKGLRERTEQLQLTQEVTILSLASLAETRDNETGQHIIRTQHYVKVLAERLQNHPEFADFLNADSIELLFKSAPLHDIGKVGIPDKILLKPGPLTPDEFEIMKGHAVLGRDSLLTAIAQLGENSFLQLACEIAYTHHEKWDGSGYPKGLQGKEIPISGRLMALADVYDALISKRIYKEAFSHDTARQIIGEGRGSHFDPAVVDIFFSNEKEFRQIADQHRDRN